MDRMVSSTGILNQESIMGLGIAGSIHVVLAQCSPDLFKVCILDWFPVTDFIYVVVHILYSLPIKCMHLRMIVNGKGLCAYKPDICLYAYARSD